jgi:hypothetical protein
MLAGAVVTKTEQSAVGWAAFARIGCADE